MIKLMDPLMKMVMVITIGVITPLHTYTYYSHVVNNPNGLASYLRYLKNPNFYKQRSPNPDELGNYIEGDIVLTPKKHMDDYEDNETPLLWNNRIIPYKISSEFYKNQPELNTILEAMRDFERMTCIRFVPHTIENDYIEIKSDGKGCWSYVGKQGGRQTVNLQIPMCLRKKGTVIHEFMHTIGFFHEHRRSERDFYIDVLWSNIKPEAQIHFDKSSLPNDDLGVEYDYGSVMHYSTFAFSKNGEPTILPRQVTNKILGQRYGFSENDVKKVNLKYKCYPFGWR